MLIGIVWLKTSVACSTKPVWVFTQGSFTFSLRKLRVSGIKKMGWFWPGFVTMVTFDELWNCSVWSYKIKSGNLLLDKKLNINAAIIIVLANFLLTLCLAFCHILSNIANLMIIYYSFIFESLLYRYDNHPVMYYLLSHLVFIDYCFIFVNVLSTICIVLF